MSGTEEKPSAAQDPAEGSREVIERELQRNEAKRTDGRQEKQSSDKKERGAEQADRRRGQSDPQRR
jgi:hypothetical protein